MDTLPAQPMDDPVYRRLMNALSGISDSLLGERETYASFLDLLILHEWDIKDRHGDTSVDGLKQQLTQYIELLESVAGEASRHMDAILDGIGVSSLCDDMEQFAGLLKRKQELQVSVGHGVKRQLSALPPV